LTEGVTTASTLQKGTRTVAWPRDEGGDVKGGETDVADVIAVSGSLSFLRFSHGPARPREQRQKKKARPVTNILNCFMVFITHLLGIMK
jgi:hypothetical protein